jgi:hypothetical protein
MGATLGLQRLDVGKKKNQEQQLLPVRCHQTYARNRDSCRRRIQRLSPPRNGQHIHCRLSPVMINELNEIIMTVCELDVKRKRSIIIQY